MYERAALVANTVSEDSGYLGGWVGGSMWSMWSMWAAGCWQVEPWKYGGGGVLEYYQGG